MVLSESDVTVSRCIFVDTNPDRPGRKISRELEVSKAQIQIGKLVINLPLPPISEPHPLEIVIFFFSYRYYSGAEFGFPG